MDDGSCDLPNCIGSCGVACIDIVDNDDFHINNINVPNYSNKTK